MERLRVGVIGATGMVGQNYLRLLKDHPWFQVTLVAASSTARAWDWAGATWADYRPFMSPITASVKANLQAVRAVGTANGRVLGRMGQIGDSITESSAYFRNVALYGPSSNETGHD